MKDILKLLVIIFSFTTVNSQIILSNDTTICSVQPFQLAAVSSTLDSLYIDDVYTGVLDIGFDFEFYGITYSKLLVSSNGYVTFDTTNASVFSPWAINAPIPNAGNEPENAIMCPWHDTDPFVGGVVYYGSFGIAPNRIYIVTWCALPMYSFTCNSLISTSQLLLYEGSNKIEMQIKDKPLCLTHNGGAAIQGLVDATSTNFDIVTDPILGLPRNFPLPWATTNEGWEFLPNGPTGYTINQIPFQIPAVGATTWYNELGDSIGSGPYLNVNPTSTTTYYAEMPVSCSGGYYSDSVTITINSSFNLSTSLVNTSCLGNDGSITIYPDVNQTSPPWNFELVDLAGNILQTANLVTTSSHTFPNLVPGNYIARVFDSGGCSNQENVTISQLVNPFSVSVSVNDVNCYNGADGRVSVDAQNAALPYQYFLNGNLNTNPYPGDSIFDGLSAGTYLVTILDDNSCAFRDTVYVT
ncbi:hypothetical protein N9D80_03145, partial [Flavobacteriales bacterium]|nr:hypothetical protein [Flavobacteriales bacterium]